MGPDDDFQKKAFRHCSANTGVMLTLSEQGVECLQLCLRMAPLECDVCRRMPEREGGTCQEVSISRAPAGHREVAVLAWKVRQPQHGKKQELNFRGAAAIPGPVCRSPEVYLGTR